MGSAITASEKSVHDSQSNIKEHKARQAQADNGQHAQKLQEHEEAKTAYEERRQRWETHDEGLPALNDEQSRTDKERRQTSEKIQKKRMELNTSNTAIRALEQDNRNWMDSYRNAPLLARVLDAIKNESRFREKPVGPMGRHVELLRPEWGSILEKQFGQILESFVVTSKADQVLLSDITRRLR
jgi:chromosome segregation ATPase